MIVDIDDYFRPSSSWKMSMERHTIKPNDVLILLLSHAVCVTRFLLPEAQLHQRWSTLYMPILKIHKISRILF